MAKRDYDAISEGYMCDDESSDESVELNLKTLWWPDRIGIDVEKLQKDVLRNGPMLSSWTAVNKVNSRVCKFCRIFFDTWSDVLSDLCAENSKWFSIETAHFKTIDQVTNSAEQGCHLCAQFISILSLSRGPKHLITQAKLRGTMFLTYLSGWAGGNVPKDCWQLGIKVGRKLGKDCCVILIPAKVSGLQNEKSSYIIDTSEFPLRLGQLRLGCKANSLVVARRWLDECHTSHKACRYSNQEGMPTRLVKLEGGRTRLCITREEEDCSVYATLSHCWGSSKVLCLQKSNLSNFRDEIPYRTLSKTFRDAIDIARAFGFVYIWIDSLCIIQDDPKDWEIEASLMAYIYGSSCLNLAATASPDGRKGCLFDRDPTYVQGGCVEVKIGGERRTYDYVDSHFFHHNLASPDTAPLIKRAWALQERLLAPRTLHFAASQIFWECGTKFACETFPDQISPVLLLNGNHLPTKELWNQWAKIVGLYTQSQLTFSRDKLVAIAGISRRIGKRTGDDYLAGLWRKNFENQLCWTTKDDDNEPTKPSHGTTIPSWSWAAIVGAVNFHSGPSLSERLQVRYINILDVDVVLDGCDQFGNIRQGDLIINSNFMVYAIISRDLCRRSIIIRGLSMPGDVKLDFGDQDDDICILLPIGIFGDDDTPANHRTLEALLLRRSGRRKGQYSRIGRFRLLQSDTPKLLHHIRKELLGYPNESKNSSYLPTETDYVSVDIDEAGEKWYKIIIV